MVRVGAITFNSMRHCTDIYGQRFCDEQYIGVEETLLYSTNMKSSEPPGRDIGLLRLERAVHFRPGESQITRQAITGKSLQFLELLINCRDRVVFSFIS